MDPVVLENLTRMLDETSPFVGSYRQMRDLAHQFLAAGRDDVSLGFVAARNSDMHRYNHPAKEEVAAKENLMRKAGTRRHGRLRRRVTKGGTAKDRALAAKRSPPRQHGSSSRSGRIRQGILGTWVRIHGVAQSSPPLKAPNGAVQSARCPGMKR